LANWEDLYQRSSWQLHKIHFGGYWEESSMLLGEEFKFK